MSENRAIQIAQDYLKREEGLDLPVEIAIYSPENASGLFDYRATWTVCFRLNVPESFESYERPVYVDALTGEAWEFDMGSDPNAEAEE